MAVDLHLLSVPGMNDIRYILDACRPYFKEDGQSSVAFIQWASASSDWFPYTQRAFAQLAQVYPLSDDRASLSENQARLDHCSVVYISGGNTYLLNHRLHESGLFNYLRQKAMEGLPVVGFSAGALVCGPNILTTHDINMLPTSHYQSMDLLPFNIVAHYPDTEDQRADEDDWLSDYHVFHTNPILALENDAYLRWDGHSLKRVQGTAWILEQGKPRVELGVTPQ